MAVRNQENKGRILTIEHPTDSSPALMVFSGNAGQLLRGDIPTINILKAMRQRAHRNGVAFAMHFQEAGAVRKNSAGMARLLEDVFGDEVTIFRYGPQESNGQIRKGLDQYTVSSKNLSIRARSVVHLPVVERNVMRRNQRAAVNTSCEHLGTLQSCCKVDLRAGVQRAQGLGDPARSHLPGREVSPQLPAFPAWRVVWIPSIACSLPR
jgi:hypothetical protein